MEGFTILVLIVLIITFVLRYAQYYLHRQQYGKSTGLYSFPILGDALKLIKSLSGMLQSLTDSNPDIYCVFFGENVTDPRDFEIILNSPKTLGKAAEFYDKVRPFVGEGLATITDNSKWKKHRKLIAPSFSQKNISGFFDIFQRNASMIIEQFKQKEGKGLFDAYHLVCEATLNTVCETSVGLDVNSNNGSTKYSSLITTVDKAIELVSLRLSKIYYFFDFTYQLFPMKHELNKATDAFQSIMKSIIMTSKEQASLRKKETENNREKVKSQKYFLEDLVWPAEDDVTLTDGDVQDHINTMIFAGYETSGSTIAFTLLVLGMYPEIQEKVYQEVIDVVGTQRELEWDDLKDFHYMERVIKEVLRMFPVAPMLFRTNQEEIALTTKTVPVGSTFMLGILKLHKDPKYWPNPNKFDPDRFLPEEVAKRHPYSWIPFSGGPRNCIGIRYAWASMKIIMATILKEYHIKTCFKDLESIPIQLGVVIKLSAGHLIEVVPRNIKPS